MAKAALGVATTPAGDAGCQVSPSQENRNQTQHSIFLSNQWSCLIEGFEFYFIFLKYRHRKKTKRKQIQMLTLSSGEGTLGNFHFLPYCVCVFYFG